MIGQAGLLAAVAAVMAVVVIPIVVRLVDRLINEEPPPRQAGRPTAMSSSPAHRAAMWIFLGSLLLFGLMWPSLARPYGLIYLIMVEVGLVIGVLRLFWRRWRRRRRAQR